MARPVSSASAVCLAWRGVEIAVRVPGVRRWRRQERVH